MFTRFALATTILAAMAFSAIAQGRPDARNMSCGEVRALIDARGAVVLTTGRHTFDRFVSHGSYCMHLEAPVPVGITTRDSNQCLVYRCQTTSHDGVWDN